MRILLVDDDSALTQVLSRHLINQRYTVDVVSDGEAGWSYATTYNYDLIVLDVILPQMDGINLCQRLRREDTTTPIVLLTSEADSTAKVTGLDAGADDYVVKPVDLEELTARIRALLRRSSANSATVLTWHDLWLNPSTSKVTYKGQPLTLTAKEYALLELFLRESHRIFSIEEILESLWSSAEFPAEATVRSHIRRLRQRLIRAGAPPDLITTSHGRGYSLKPLVDFTNSISSSAAAIESDPSNRPDRPDQPKQQPDRQLEQGGFNLAGQINAETLPQSKSQHLSRLLLSVNLDPMFADALTKLAINAGIRIVAVPASVAEARLSGSTANQPLHGLLLNLTEADTALPLLKTAHQLDIPAIAIAEHSNLSQQLNILRQGGICLPSSATPQQALTVIIQTLNRLEPAKILAIDTEPAWLHLLPLHLWNLEMHVIDSPHQLWATLETLKPEALLLGELPEVGGLELCQLLRSDPTWQHLPVLLLSDSADAAIQEQAFMAGVDDYLSKPVTARDLANRLICRIRRVQHCRYRC